ncbi:MAG TPA: hypothetical protein VNK04_08840 [Gemmataceae bacterium]|nr:hypothetical protein [Gemmataceae bacterium]
MSASLRALLAGVIDYAGLFPPAQLPLDQAIRNYARYRTGPDAWMLGRFVIPAARLAELPPYCNEVAPLKLSVLGRGGGMTREPLQGMADDLETILAFHRDWGERAAIEALELPLADEVVQPTQKKDPQGGLAGLTTALEKAGLPLKITYFEINPGPDWRTRFDLLSAILVADPSRRLGFKLRTGGLHASAVPAVADVSFVLTACCRNRVPLKFTAGLHHPLRHFDAGLQTKMHGFLNIFVAGVLAHARRLDEDQVRPIIEDEDAGHFGFDDDGLHWKDLRAATEEIVTARRWVTSFGSCSFDEPRDDLRALGLLT